LSKAASEVLPSRRITRRAQGRPGPATEKRGGGVEKKKRKKKKKKRKKKKPGDKWRDTA